MLDAIKQINILIFTISHLVPAIFITTVEIREHTSKITIAQLTAIHTIRGWQLLYHFHLVSIGKGGIVSPHLQPRSEHKPPPVVVIKKELREEDEMDDMEETGSRRRGGDGREMVSTSR
jgi:hypothetical protein